MTQTQEHILRFLDILRHLADVKLQDLSEDTTEAQWYEPWNFILNRIVEKISKDLTVAPQCRLVRIHIAEDDNTRMLPVTLSSYISLGINRDQRL